MKFVYMVLFMALLTAGCGSKESQKAAPAVQASAPVSATAAPHTATTQGDLLSPERIAALKQTFTSKDKKDYVLTASFIVDTSIPPADLAELKQAGKVPYGFICQLDEIKLSGDETLSQMVQGRANFYIQDSEGNVVLPKKTMSLAKMCAH
jgi:PBP1b-binding outer membrane lipoprotein LpoB